MSGGKQEDGQRGVVDPAALHQRPLSRIRFAEVETDDIRFKSCDLLGEWLGAVAAVNQAVTPKARAKRGDGASAGMVHP